ncbi:MAG: hypothetical protein M3P18_25440, partial [Actinomycetota bacterium]|nr:hypothetical protein [Actinomycetota bacterium]
QARQGALALSSAGRDSQSAQARLRATQQKTQSALARSKAKLRGLSSGLSGAIGTVQYTSPAKKGASGSVQGTVTISNSARIPLSAVCVVNVGGVAYAVISRGIAPGGSATEPFRFAYVGTAPAGVSAGGCGRL